MRSTAAIVALSMGLNACSPGPGAAPEPEAANPQTVVAPPPASAERPPSLAYSFKLPDASTTTPPILGNDCAGVAKFPMEPGGDKGAVQNWQIVPEHVISLCSAELAASPDDPINMVRLARAYIKKKDIAEARRHLTAAEKLGYPVASYLLAVTEADAGNSQAASAAFARARKGYAAKFERGDGDAFLIYGMMEIFDREGRVGTTIGEEWLVRGAAGGYGDTLYFVGLELIKAANDILEKYPDQVMVVSKAKFMGEEFIRFASLGKHTHALLWRALYLIAQTADQVSSSTTNELKLNEAKAMLQEARNHNVSALNGPIDDMLAQFPTLYAMQEQKRRQEQQRQAEQDARWWAENGEAVAATALVTFALLAGFGKAAEGYDPAVGNDMECALAEMYGGAELEARQFWGIC